MEITTFKIIAVIIILIITITIIVLLYKLYRQIFGYTYTNCPNNHDTAARHGASKCNKCGNKL